MRKFLLLCCISFGLLSCSKKENDTSSNATVTLPTVTASAALPAVVSSSAPDNPASSPKTEVTQATSSASSSPSLSKTPDCLITSNSIGSIRIGESLNSLKAQLPKLQTKNYSDGDGIEYVSLAVNGYELAAYKPESNKDKLDALILNEDKQVKCATSEGVGVGMLLADAEKHYGAVKKVLRNDVNSYQEVVFSRSPVKIRFLSTDGGNFENVKDDVLETSKVNREATIDRIIVSLD